MPTLKDDLLGAIAHWRNKSAEAELSSTEADKSFAQGYLRGLAVAYDHAAKRLETILVANVPKVRPAAVKAARRVLHGKRQLPPVA